MAFIHSGHLGWHEGEQQMRSLLRMPYQENPTSPFLTPGAAHMLQISPLLALGALDDQGRPWTTVWGGEPGFARSIGQSVVGVKTLVDRLHDPVVGALVGGKGDGEVSLERAGGKMVSGLAIDLATRRRVKLFARMVGGAMDRLDSDGQDVDMGTGQVQLVMRVEQSLGNCPKYLNKKQITPASSKPTLISDSTRLPDEAINLLTKSDLFFMSSSNQDMDMDTNHRGGAPGFVRVVRNDASGAVLAYPEYSGNRLYQTLGNLQTNPRTGLVFPDFETGDVLYITGTTEVLVGKQAAALLPRSNLAVKVNVTAARFVREGLAFRGKLDERSPYNPPVRLLATERALPDAQAYSQNAVYATLVKKDILTPTIARFRFSVSDPVAAGRWKPGQYVALAFEAELGMGYSHMRDDNPKSLNDDYTRTFTVSSVMGYGLPEDEFEITIRKVGVVTDFLFRQNVRARLEIPLKGFGGEFAVRQDEGETVPFVAGGIGITPVLSQLSSLDLKRLRLLWTVNIRDVGLVSDTFKRCPQLATSTRVFVSGIDNENAHDEETLTGVEYSGAHVLGRRMLAEDILTLKQIEHNIPTTTPAPQTRPRRPDLSTFFSTLELVDTSGENRTHHNANAVPIPGDISAAFRTLADAFERMRQEGGVENGLLVSLVESLMADAEMPPREVKGVPDSFLDELERVPKKALKKTDTCPICNNPFLDDEYPLVVRLPCHDTHLFDLECIQPWLKLHPTCPLDRMDLMKKKEPPPPPEEEEEDGEWDDMYA